MDILSIADLLKEFISAEVEILNTHHIKHPTTIGAMYEGLTQTVLSSSIFKGLNLRVVKNSFIMGCNVEFDILLVEGKGKEIPYSGRFEFNPEQVISVIQVKKNLYSKDLQEGYNNLSFLSDYYKSRKSELYMGRLFRDSFRSICRKDWTAKNEGELTKNEESIFYSLKIEALQPVRIIWGYNGFASEENFRKSFVDYLGKNLTKDFSKRILGFAPHNLPNLIICGKYTLLKQNGMPFSVPIQKDNWWPFYTSSSYNPTYFFLEAIWTRLSYKFDLPVDIFGEDLTMEPANRFIDCRIQEHNGHNPWAYIYRNLNEDILRSNIEVSEWEPEVLDLIQFVVINRLCNKEEIDLINNEELEEFVKTGLYSSLNDFVEKTKTTGLVFVEKGKLKLLTDECRCAIMPDQRLVAGENKSGRFTNWMTKQINKDK